MKDIAQTNEIHELEDLRITGMYLIDSVNQSPGHRRYISCESGPPSIDGTIDESELVHKDHHRGSLH